VAVSCRIVRGRAEDAVACERFGDAVQALAGDVFAEDALHDRRGDRVGLQAVQALAGDGLARVGVRAEIDQVVAVLRATAETQERLLTVPGGPGTVRVGLDPAGFD
jgi:hypothetical protein